VKNEREVGTTSHSAVREGVTEATGPCREHSTECRLFKLLELRSKVVNWALLENAVYHNAEQLISHLCLSVGLHVFLHPRIIALSGGEVCYPGLSCCARVEKFGVWTTNIDLVIWSDKSGNVGVSYCTLMYILRCVITFCLIFKHRPNRQLKCRRFNDHFSYIVSRVRVRVRVSEVN